MIVSQFRSFALAAAVLTAATVLVVAPLRAAAQPASRPAYNRTTVIGASDEHLWVAETTTDATALFHRTFQGGFDEPREFQAKLAHITVDGASAVLFFSRGEVVETDVHTTLDKPCADLPGRQAPLDAVAIGGRIYALVRSSTANDMPASSEPGAPTSAASFDPGASDISLLMLGPDGWAGVAPCPVQVTVGRAGQASPRLLNDAGNLLVFWPDKDGGIHWAALDAAARSWRAGNRIDTPGLQRIIPLTVARVPALVVATTEQGSESLRAFRLLGGSLLDAKPQWSEGELVLSSIENHTPPLRLTDAAGFNQHLVLAMTDASGQRFLRFARFGDKPVETTLALPGALNPSLDQQLHNAIQVATLVLMAVVLALLFAFRRGSTMRDPILPAEYALAFYFQRIGAAAIDLAPFALAAKFWLHISLQDALRVLFDWAYAGALPTTPFIIWWSATSLMYASYTLLLELIMRRTPGKYFFGTRVVNDDGRPARVWQCVVRNAMRVVELHPPFWLPLLVLLVLGRGRQRIGDIFAQTLVVRRVRSEPPPGESPEEPAAKAGEENEPPE